MAQDGIIFKGLRCIIPATLRQKIREKLHSTHIGVQGCLRRARKLVYWPAMNSNITDYLSKCEVCNTFQPQQQKEPLISHEIPHRPWEKMASDIFTFDSKDYLCTVDYYSNYFELDHLYDKTAPEGVKKLKQHFSNHGIPDKLHSDNMPFGSREFQDFAREYELEHLTSSPDYPQSNGKVENAIKTAKSLMKKARESGQDFYLSLLAWRNTPTEGMGSSPAQRLFIRRTKTSLPTASRLLEPEPVKQVREKLYERKEIQAKYFNKGSKELPSLQEGETVRMKPKAHDHAKRWVKAQVEKQVDVRSYAVRTEDGRQYRRNRKHLRKSRETFVPDRTPPMTEPLPHHTSPHVPLNPATVVLPQAHPRTPVNPTTPHRLTKVPVHDDTGVSVSPAKPASVPVSVTRSGRVSKPPK